MVVIGQAAQIWLEDEIFGTHTQRLPAQLGGQQRTHFVEDVDTQTGEICLAQAKAAQEQMRANQHFVFRRSKRFSEAHAQYRNQSLTLESVQNSRSCPAMASTASVREMAEFSLPNADLSLAGDCPSRVDRGRL